MMLPPLGSAHLAECPFCGSLSGELHNVCQTHFVHCLACQAYGPAHTGQTPPEAVARWNERNGRASSPDPDLDAGATHIGEIPRVFDFF